MNRPQPVLAPGQPGPIARDIVIVEVGPRDGLQNEASLVPSPVKIAFVDMLARSGLPVIETTSFVNPKRVPQLADAAQVMTGIRRLLGVQYPVLIPNEQGLTRAVAAGAREIALFVAATEAFSTANVGTSIDGTFERFEPVVDRAKELGLRVRGYVSVAFGCPYSGPVPAAGVVAVAERLLALGCDEISLADTIGAATPVLVREILIAVQPSVPTERLAMHFHDTSGHALANVDEALNLGVRIFDSAAGGLGGCPFAPGAPGNLATDRLVAHVEHLGLRTGIDLDAVADAVMLLRPYLPRLGYLNA